MCGCGCRCSSGHQKRGHEMGCGHGHGRRFLTKEEQAEKLKNYAEELRKELAAVEERIKELKS